MAQVTYEEIECKSVLHPVKGMPFNWSINPYRGCVHGCHYCFARRFHGYLDLNADEDFTSYIMVKVNAPQVLRQELSRRRLHESVALGTATDPYQPIEGKYRITRRILEALADHHTPVGIVTKGTMIVRDIDILSAMPTATVHFSIATLDEGVWAQMEPGTPPPRSRLRALERLTRAGVHAGVALAPVVPGITDSPASLEAVARAAADAGAHFFGGRALYLMPGVKEHFARFLEAERPDLSPWYAKLYPGAYAPRSYALDVEDVLEDLRARFGLARRERQARIEEPEQLALPLG